MTATPYLATVHHVRSAPIRHDFTYRTCSWVTDLGPTNPTAGLSWWQRPVVRFRARDHVGDTDDWRTNLDVLLRDRGVEVPGARVVALTGAATLGYAFDPLTVYWVLDGAGEVAVVVAEVRNTYGERHCYLVTADDRGRATTQKQLYVSPFNDVSGYYTMSVPPPSSDGFDIRITLHRNGHPPFVATWRGRRPGTLGERLRLGLHIPLASQIVSLRIRVQGIRLWARRLPIVPRPQPSEEDR